MIYLIAALVLVSPAPPACLWWSRTERRCRDADMEIIGPWNPIPPGYMPPIMSDFFYGSEPPAWGTYRTEQAPPASLE